MSTPQSDTRPTVLIVDDNAAMLAVVRDVLAIAFPHLRILQADSGAHAMARFARHAPELVVMDVQLPDADGIELTRRILAMSPQTSVVVISALPEPGLAEEAMAAGARAFIAKDDLYGELVTLMSRLPGIQRAIP